MSPELPSGLDAIVTKLMSDPGIMAAVNEAAAELGGSAPAPQTEGKENARGDDAPATAPLAALLGGMPKRDTDDTERQRRRELLNALKPYLGAHRRETIDYMLGIERLGDALRSARKP